MHIMCSHILIFMSSKINYWLSMAVYREFFSYTHELTSCIMHRTCKPSCHIMSCVNICTCGDSWLGDCIISVTLEEVASSFPPGVSLVLKTSCT